MAYVADGEYGLQVIDVADPANPVVAGSMDLWDETWGIDLAGSIAYVATTHWGLQLISVNNPENPALLSRFYSAWAMDVAVSGSFAYLLDLCDGLRIIDLTDPNDPVLLGSVLTPGQPRDVLISGSTAYVSDSGGLSVIDISDPHEPFIVGSIEGGAQGIALFGPRLYAAAGSHGLGVLDISSCQVGFADLDGDGAVGFADLQLLLAAWGACPPPPSDCRADLDGDGVVGLADLTLLLDGWE